MEKLIIFTDGSCFQNGSKNAYGGIGIHFPDKQLPDVSKVYRKGFCTNQRAELYAILTAVRYVNERIGLKDKKVLIKTDSDYSINCVTKWIANWIRNDWQTTAGKPVANREFIESINRYYTEYDITFQHVEAHTGGSDPDSVGNEIADQLAKKASLRMSDEKANEMIDKAAETDRKKVEKAKEIEERKNEKAKQIQEKKAGKRIVVQLIGAR